MITEDVLWLQLFMPTWPTDCIPPLQYRSACKSHKIYKLQWFIRGPPYQQARCAMRIMSVRPVLVCFPTCILL